MAYPRLFDPIRIGNLQLKNRIVMAPMESHLGNADGSVSTEQIAYYR
jgi:2,4-dienoyl-CoA reductase (NADPH2)